MSRSIFKKVYLGNDTSGLDISDRITHLRFVQSTKKDDGLDLMAEGEDAEYLLELDELANGKAVVFNFGYIGAEISPTYRAVITDIEPTYTTEGVKVTIKCGDRGRAMRHARSKKVWKKKNTGQIFKEIAGMYNMGTYLEIPAGGFIEHASLPQGSIDYMSFLQMLASKEKDGNYICFASGDDLHLVTRAVGDTSTNTIVVGQYDNLIEFAIKHRETTAPSGLNEVGTALGKVTAKTSLDNIVTGETAIYASSSALYMKDKSGNRTLLIDDNGRRTDAAKAVFREDQLNSLAQNAAITLNKVKAAPPQEKLKVGQAIRVPLNADQAPTVVNDRDNGGVLLSGLTNGYELQTPSAQSDEETLNVANAIHKEATHKVLTADLKEFGNPLRKPNTIITVAGIATRYIGNWLIEGVQSDVGLNSYITTCTCSKNGIKRGIKTTGSNTTKGAENDDKVFIGLQGADNGRVFERDSKGGKKTIEYTPPPKK